MPTINTPKSFRVNQNRREKKLNCLIGTGAAENKRKDNNFNTFKYNDKKLKLTRSAKNG